LQISTLILNAVRRRPIPPIHASRFTIHQHIRAAFTLIELLVVIIMIAILAGLLFPAFIGAQNQAKKVQAKNDLTQIVTAVNAFYTEYGMYPTNPATDVTFSNNNNTVFDVLRNMTGTTPGNTSNPRGIVFINVPTAKDQVNPKSGIKTSSGVWYDPYGMPYNVRIDGTYDNQIANPYTSNAGPTPNLQAGVIAWSLGSDGVQGTDFKASDDVISWQ
jgi:prepilin-type N-terminal cleavage/methylation domain-containing protein